MKGSMKNNPKPTPLTHFDSSLILRNLFALMEMPRCYVPATLL